MTYRDVDWLAEREHVAAMEARARNRRAERWVAGWNMGGYLPETDPAVFDNLTDATAYLRETVETWLDQDYETPEARTANGGMDDPDATAEDIVTMTLDGADGWYGDMHLWAERHYCDDVCAAEHGRETEGN
jgi:hypothetical protein